jgi:hemerythrin
MKTVAKLSITGSQADHLVLTHLIESMGCMCRLPAALDRQCDTCPQENVGFCLATVTALGNRTLNLLLDHFNREEALMSSLPDTAANFAHCRRHRQEHALLTTDYNRMTGKFDARDPGRGVRHLERFVLDWSRDHALKFDAELTALLEQKSPHAIAPHPKTGPSQSLQRASFQPHGQRSTLKIIAPSQHRWQDPMGVATLV